MKRMVLLLALFSSAALADVKPVGKVEAECNKQARIVSQIYEEFMLGDSEQKTVAGHISETASPQSAAWVRATVRQIYADSSSRRVNVSATVFKYESDCNQYPDKYIRDKDLIR